jgi:hypothetical protein
MVLVPFNQLLSTLLPLLPWHRCCCCYCCCCCRLQALFVLYESASGFALFDIKGLDEIGQAVDKVQASVSDMQRFGKVAKLTAFKPFGNAADALEQINAISESNLTDELKNFVSMNLPKVGTDKQIDVSVPGEGSQRTFNGPATVEPQGGCQRVSCVRT